MIDQNPEPESIQNLGCRPDSWITSRGDDQHLHTQRIRGHRLRHWLPLPSCLMNMHRIQRIMFETCMMNHFNHHVWWTCIISILFDEHVRLLFLCEHWWLKQLSTFPERSECSSGDMFTTIPMIRWEDPSLDPQIRSACCSKIVGFSWLKNGWLRTVHRLQRMIREPAQHVRQHEPWGPRI